MPLDYPNIVPQNNLRLPDALTVKHGPTGLLSRFVLEGDKAVRRIGLRLRVRHDFDELAWLNQREVSSGSWFRLVDAYNPKYTTLTPENAFWISGEDEDGNVAASWAARVFYWPETNLAEQAVSFFYGRDDGQRCRVTAPAAKLISGIVLCGGAAWIRPDFRGKRLGYLVPRILKAYAYSRWPVDWSICYVSRTLIEKGVAAGYGQKNFSYSIFYPGSPWGDLEVAVAYTPIAEAYDDLTSFMEEELLGAAEQVTSLSNLSEHNVTSTSPDGVFHGNSSLWY